VPVQRKNPYRSRIPLHVTNSDDTSLHATLGVITPEMCAGHFPRHPCVPVAILMQSLSHAAGQLFSSRTGSPGYVVVHADVNAHELAFAGTHVSVEAHHVGRHAEGEQFRARAFTADGTTLGELGLVVQGC
jgi:3-hydroxymyristoyl/3-hydroxydecanoyl-(acyl carrier protein) dehydratase